jgi:hypothetical protein
MISASTLAVVPLLSHDDDPHWKVVRMPYDALTGPALSTLQPGYLVKFDAARANVNPALAADDAALEGVIIDVPNDPANPTDTSVAIALSGSFDLSALKYADGASPISAAAITRLRNVGIFSDTAVKGGVFAP